MSNLQQFKIIRVKNLDKCQERISELLEDGWDILNSNYAGNGWVIYIFGK